MSITDEVGLPQLGEAITKDQTPMHLKELLEN